MCIFYFVLCMVYNKFLRFIIGKNRDCVFMIDIMGFFKIIILSLFYKKIIIVKENKKCLWNEGKNENFLGRFMWENFLIKGDFLCFMFIVRFFFVVGNVWICINFDY